MFEDIQELLQQVSEDRTVPRNIRTKVDECVEILNDEKKEKTIKINTVTSILDEASNDPNIPTYTRTQIWNIVSALESKQ